MFPVVSKSSDGFYDYIDLLVHLDLKSYRREQGSEIWMVNDNGKWKPEFILDDIISELYGPSQAQHENYDSDNLGM